MSKKKASKTALLELASDGFNLHLNSKKLKGLSKKEIIEQCEWYDGWLKNIIQKAKAI